jgi:hypothetical protein
VSRGFKVSLGLLLGLPLVLILIGSDPVLEGAAVALLFGWLRHAFGVLPHVTLNPSGIGLFALCLVAAAVVGHRFCRWLWQGSGRTEPWRARWTLAGLAGILLLFASGMAFTGAAHQIGWLLRSPSALVRSPGNERNAYASLKTIASAQADFRGNDRDGNRIRDFWRADIAGLYGLKPEGGEETIKLIEGSVAGADGRPSIALEAFVVKAPKAGYWYRALRFKGETTPDPDRFAAIAYPDSASAGKVMYIISHENVLYRKDVGTGAIPETYPEDPLREGWLKFD